MIVQLNSDWRLSSDEMQWALQRGSRCKDGSIRWNGVSYHREFDAALLEAVRRQIGLSCGVYGPEALKPLSSFFQEMREMVRGARDQRAA